MFRGVTPLSLDSKGRFAVPAKYHDVLKSSCDSRLVITVDSPKCLLIYPQPVWEPIEKRLLTGLSSFNPKIRAMQRLLVGNACDVAMDNAGRLLIVAQLRQFVGLTKEVVLVGQGEKFELWDAQKWNQEIETALEFKDGDMPPELEGFLCKRCLCAFASIA